MRFIQKISAAFGIVFVAVALLGFFTGGMSMDAHMESSARVLGLFPVNAVHNAVHFAFGVWGILAAGSALQARRFCLLSGAIYLVLAGLGFVLPETFGLIPIGGNDIALHAVLGIALTVVGAMTSDTAPATARA
jgi:hypothetical protein